jgi:hypothetical protein
VSPLLRQRCLKPASRAARAQVVAAKLLEQRFIAVHPAGAAPHAGLGRVALAPFEVVPELPPQAGGRPKVQPDGR